jgi:hypothetical protein
MKGILENLEWIALGISVGIVIGLLIRALERLDTIIELLT